MAELGCIGRAILRSGVCPTPAEKLQSAWDGGFGSGLAAPRNNVVLIGTNFLGGVVALRKFRVGLTGPSDAPSGDAFTKGCLGVQPERKRTSAIEPANQTTTIESANPREAQTPKPPRARTRKKPASACLEDGALQNLQETA